MDFFDVINTRKTIRKYKQELPPTEDIERIIDSARLAPSATNSQNWRFVAVYNSDLKQKMFDAVNEAYDEIKTWEDDEDFRNKVEGSRRFSTFFVDAPVIIVCIEESRSSYMNDVFSKNVNDINERQQARPDSSLLSMGAAIENMSLAAHALGYGTCWMCAPIVAYKKLKTIFNVADDSKIVSLLVVGVPEDSSAKPLKKSLNEIMQIIQ